MALIALAPEATEEHVRELARALASEAAASVPAGVVLDASRMPVIDRFTAEAFRDLARTLGLLGVPVALAGLSAGAAGALALLGFDPQPLRPVRTPEEARALFCARAG